MLSRFDPREIPSWRRGITPFATGDGGDFIEPPPANGGGDSSGDPTGGDPPSSAAADAAARSEGHVTYDSTFTGDSTKTESDYQGSATGDFGEFGAPTETGDGGAAAVDAATGGSGGQGTLEYGNWTPAFFMPSRRSIGGIVAQVTIDEQASDDLQITEHPVEQGAPIADHAFKRPAQVTIRAGWTRQYAWDLSAQSGVYGLLLSWQAALLPFDVYTGKRKYTNMLIERLQVTTDQHSEYALMATIACRQVIIVSTASTTVQMSSDSDNNKTDAESNGSESDGGDKQSKETGPVDTSRAGANVTGGVVTGEQFGPPNTSAYNAALDGPQAGQVNNQMNNNGAEQPNNPPISDYYQGPF